MMQTEPIVTLDVGSSKVLCVVAEPTDDSFRVLGVGRVDSEGIRRGTVNDVSAAVSVVRQAVSEALQTSGLTDIKRIWAAIGGDTLRSRNCTGVAVLRSNEVTDVDVELAQDNVRHNALRESEGQDLLKLIPQGFQCGDTWAPKNPLGLVGPKIEAMMHAVYGSTTNAENLKRVIQRAGLELANYEPHPWAASQAVLSDTDKQCGAVVIDLGDQTTSITFFEEGIVRLTDVRPWGAELLTKDLATQFSLEMDWAEKLKFSRSASCNLSNVKPNETVELEIAGEQRAFQRQKLVETLHTRITEFFELYKKLLASARALDRVHVVVLTGGGAQLKDIAQLAEKIFERPVRIGVPNFLLDEPSLLRQPDAAVATGLLKCANEARIQALSSRRTKRGSSMLVRFKTFFLGQY